MVEVSWTPQSLLDLENIAKFIAQDSLRYAKLQVKLFFEEVSILEKFPKSGRIVPELNQTNIREIVLGNYRIVYKIISPATIHILTIHHSARRLTISKFKKS